MESPVQETKQDLAERIFTSDKLPELVSAQIMASLENGRFDATRMDPSAINAITNPNWIQAHIGDTWEVARLFMATRLALVGINEVLKKTTNKEIPDEVCFWASMVTSVTIPSLIELNLVPVAGNTADAADLFGVGVGALVIIASHYNRENLQKLVISAADSFDKWLHPNKHANAANIESVNVGEIK